MIFQGEAIAIAAQNTTTTQSISEVLRFPSGRRFAMCIAASRQSSLGSAALGCVVSRQKPSHTSNTGLCGAPAGDGYLVVAPGFERHLDRTPNISTACAWFNDFPRADGENPIREWWRQPGLLTSWRFHNNYWR